MARRKAEATPSLSAAESPGPLERLLHAFPEAVADAYREYAPNKITTYLVVLAQEFNSYYGEKKIADHPYRVALAEAVSVVIGNGLFLLGMSAPERM